VTGLPKSSKIAGKKIGLLVLICVAAAIVGAIYWSPYETLHQMRADIKAGKVELLDQDIDYTSVREGLKRDFRALAVDEVEEDPSLKNRLLGVLGLAIGAPIADTAIDYMVSPAGLRRILSGNIPLLSSRSEQAEADARDFNDNDDDGSAPVAGVAQPPVSRVSSTSGQYRDINHFDCLIKNTSGSATDLLFTRRGLLSWQLTHVKLMPSRR
jgi:hypothetical protein